MEKLKIPSQVILQTHEIIVQAVLRIFNQCLVLGYFTNSWKHSLLHVILKSKDKDPSNSKSFRPIMLLPELAKVFERTIKNRMLSEIAEENIFHDSQFGFCKGRHTADAINHLLETVNTASTKYTIAIFMDIKGAFDKCVVACS
jgi:hypothetical protein